MVHVQGHLREAFQRLVDNDFAGYDEVFHDEALPPSMLLDRLSGCTDVMPGDVCEQLGLPRGCNYAQGTGAFMLEHQMQSPRDFDELDKALLDG